MDAPQQSALAALQAGRNPEQVVAMFVQAGWPDHAARDVVASVQRMMPPQAPTPQPWAPQAAQAPTAQAPTAQAPTAQAPTLVTPAPDLYGTPAPSTPAPQAAPSDGAVTSPGGSWPLTVGLVAGLVGVGLIIVMFFAPFFDGLGPRERVEAMGSGQAFLLILLAPVVPWLILLAMVLTHHIGYGRRWARAREAGLVKGRGRRASLLVLNWLLVGVVPVLAVVGVFFLWIVWVAMGIMCGEAVSENCGM